jgi:hypothetical protein
VSPRATALLGAALVAAPAATAAAQWTAPTASTQAAPQPSLYPYGTTAPPGTTPPPNPYGSMQAGGLSPPPPLPVSPPQGTGQTAEQLDQAKKRDAGRGLEWVWLNVEGGFSHVGLRTFNVRDDAFTAGFVDTTASGGQIGAGLGARLLFFTFGVRGRLGFYSPYRIFSVGPEAGLHIPVGKLDPHVDLGGGYVTFAGIDDAHTHADSPLALRGFYLRVGSGLDYYLLPLLSLGLNASFDLLGLTRPALAKGALDKLKASPGLSDADRAAADKLAAEESSFGAAVVLTGTAGLHF